MAGDTEIIPISGGQSVEISAGRRRAQASCLAFSIYEGGLWRIIDFWFLQNMNEGWIPYVLAKDIAGNPHPFAKKPHDWQIRVAGGVADKAGNWQLVLPGGAEYRGMARSSSRKAGKHVLFQFFSNNEDKEPNTEVRFLIK
jgi:hypothetical protein